MKRFVIAGMLLVSLSLVSHPARAGTGPDFREIYDLLRTNAPGLTEAELNRAAVAGLLQQLRGRATLVDPAGQTNSGFLKFSLLDRGIAVTRIEKLGASAADALRSEFPAAAATNQFKGFILDLRFASGDDYAAAVGLAELFVARDRELLDWGEGPVRSHAETVTIDLPVVVLVNQETVGAPEALAGILRECGVALILGNPTAGRALLGREFALSDGQTLRVGSVPVKLADGSTIPVTGLKPDITVPLALEQERALAAEPFGTVGSLTPTNASSARPLRSRRPSEAELVRERRENTNLAAATPVHDPQPVKPVIVDPVLARAVDLLKGLAVVRGHR